MGYNLEASFQINNPTKAISSNAMCFDFASTLTALLSSSLTYSPFTSQIQLIPSLRTCCTLSVSPSCSLYLPLSTFSPCCWCLFLLLGIGLASAMLLCSIQSQSQPQCRPQSQALSEVSVVVRPSCSPPGWCAGASGAGSRGSGRGQRCWAGTWGRWAHRRRGAMSLEGEPAGSLHPIETADKWPHS